MLQLPTHVADFKKCYRPVSDDVLPANLFTALVFM
jgi:hypothetical protein